MTAFDYLPPLSHDDQAIAPDHGLFTVQPLTGGLGAEIGGVDLAKPLADEMKGALRQVLLHHLSWSSVTRD